MQHRWYDKDPTLSLAINLFRNLETEKQDLCADFILGEMEQRGLNPDLDIPNHFEYFFKRWYDSDAKVFRAIEHLKEVDVAIKKELSLGVIEYIQQLEKNLGKKQ